MGAPANLWADLIEVNKTVDGLIERVRRAIEPSQPISREIPFWGTIEVRFANLPPTYGSTLSPSSDLIAGNNIKREVYQNSSSRVYIRDLSFQTYLLRDINLGTFSGPTRNYEARVMNNVQRMPFNWRWNFETSITQKKYCETGRVLAQAGGRQQAGTKLSFKDPLILEPRENLTLECELLSFGMRTATDNFTAAVVSCIISGYREGF